MTAEAADIPEPTALATALDALAAGMRQFPNMPVTPYEIALMFRAAARIRELEADNARLRSIDEALRRMIAAAGRADGFDRKVLEEAKVCLEKRWRM